MRGIVSAFLIFLLLFYLARLIIFVIRRTMMLVQIYSLKKQCGAKISLHSFPYRPMWMTGKRADITVEILDTVYHIRLYSGGTLGKSVHFANEEYSCIFTELRGVHEAKRKIAGQNTPGLTSGISLSCRVVVLPKLLLPQEDEGKKIVPVILMNPAPGAVSYVTEEKTSVQVLFTGDTLYGAKVFTASTFVRYADRESRRVKPQDLCDKAPR